jgi:disulfide bond formation protein DsbB
MKAQTSQTRQSSVCQQCMIIRYFIATAVTIVVLALVASDDIKFLAMFTPERASVAIVVAGALMAGVKYWLWRRETSEQAFETD